MAYKGRYKPQNPQKYKGDPTNIVYRSLLERRFMVYCDSNPSILEWSSEEIVVPYKSPIDNRWHRYFVDFWIETINKEGQIEHSLIEIKPKKQTIQPHISENKVTKGKMQEIKDWVINNAKWEAAKSFCQDKGWKFIILTEKEIFGKEIIT